MVSGDAGKSAACSRDFVGHGSRFFAGTGLANEDVLGEAASYWHGRTANGERLAVIAIPPLASKDLVTNLNVDMRRGIHGGKTGRGAFLELLVVRVNIFNDTAEVIAVAGCDAGG